MGGFLGDVVNVATLGLSDAIGLTGDAPEVKNTSAESIREDRKANSRKRKALYGTEGDALGDEVNQVGMSNRGNLFGN